MSSITRIHTICVCGAGTMGSGIAQIMAQAGYDTIQFDIDKTMLEKSRTAILNSLQRLLEKNKITEDAREATLSRLKFTDNIEECKAGLIIEAIVEDKSAKTLLLQRLASLNNSNTIFATNTSSISVVEIARGTPIAPRLAGMHFFNPPQLMKLVEIVKTEFVSDLVINTLVALTRQLNKIPVVCNDAAGFIVNRVARPYYLEALILVEKGLADAESIDAVMEASAFKMGPFKLMDLIGIDINYSVSKIVWESLGYPERLKPSLLQKEKVEQKELGRKSGKGFYNYDSYTIGN